MPCPPCSRRVFSRVHFKEPNGRPGCDFIGLNYYRYKSLASNPTCLHVWHVLAHKCIKTNGRRCPPHRLLEPTLACHTQPPRSRGVMDWKLSPSCNEGEVMTDMPYAL